MSIWVCMHIRRAFMHMHVHLRYAMQHQRTFNNTWLKYNVGFLSFFFFPSNECIFYRYHITIYTDSERTYKYKYIHYILSQISEVYIIMELWWVETKLRLKHRVHPHHYNCTQKKRKNCVHGTWTRIAFSRSRVEYNLDAQP